MNDDLMGDIFAKSEDTISGPQHEFKEYTINPADFMGFSVIWYGTTGTGKSFHIRACLNAVKHNFARVILFSPTNSISRDFTNIINEVMIFSDLTEQKFVECIQTQKKIADVYQNVVNNIDNLKKLFSLCASGDEQAKYNYIINERANRINQINYNNDPPNIKAQKIEDLRKTVDEKLILFFKYCIIPKRQNISIKDLSPSEIECLRNIDIDPRTLFIFDDLQEELTAFSKKKTGECALEFKNLFTKARHYHFTTWFTYQDDKALLPQCRKSAKISIFTDAASANGFITRATNGLDKESQKIGTELVSSMYSGSGDYRKLIFFKERNGSDRFQYSIAKNPGLFKVGSAIVNNFCDSIRLN